MPVTEIPVAAAPLAQPRFVDYSHLIGRPRVGPRNHLSKADVLALLPQLADWDTTERIRGISKESQRIKALHQRHERWMRGANKILAWLNLFPGEGWQERWVNSGADKSLAWIDTMDPFDPRKPRVQRLDYTGALSALFLHRIILPSYDILNEFKCGKTLARARAIMRPDLFEQVQHIAERRGTSKLHIDQALAAISKIVVHTGRDVDQLAADDLLELFAWSVSGRGYGVIGLHLSWDLLTEMGVTPFGTTMRGQLLHGRRPTEELVDFHQVQCVAVRDVLVRYLNQRRPSVDYNTLLTQAGVLAGRFWADIEKHHPGIDSLHLPEPVAAEWKERIRVRTDHKGELKHRQDVLHLLNQVRAFYLDIQEWARDDPSWVAWAVPSPVSRREVQGYEKVLKQRQAVMHQRIRERLPHLPVLADTAFRCRDETAALLQAAQAYPLGTVFEHAGTQYVRVTPSNNVTRAGTGTDPSVHVRETSTGKLLNATFREDEMFWAWAVIETLRHTGVRLEELLEITHLALVSYRLPDTGELVPLLQIVPSKSNEERLLLINPELASALALIVTRLRNRHKGAIPMVPRYDQHERVTGPPLPHLFQRHRGGRSYAISAAQVKKLINRVLTETGLTDASGEPLNYTPHDFRRMFATDAVAGGLPVHIVARLLGHASLETTQAYLNPRELHLMGAFSRSSERRRLLGQGIPAVA